MFEDYEDVCDHKSVMDVNFRGSVYCTQFAIPHLKQSRGKIIVISSVLGWSNCPKLSIYGATKAALISFFETLRVEVGSEIGITIVTPGLVDSEITDNKFMSKGSYPDNSHTHKFPMILNFQPLVTFKSQVSISNVEFVAMESVEDLLEDLLSRADGVVHRSCFSEPGKTKTSYKYNQHLPVRESSSNDSLEHNTA
ncbi:11-beta-hydroxysteroid dehydrogenase A-like isoform X1 [Apium graveolens]|uniref:11-beta-hydroxysteroid dehydrogenase A-like isoform X1 n=1 Tax=Apium graveolens TaxID=4045 RepID=UPI003D79A93C